MKPTGTITIGTARSLPGPGTIAAALLAIAAAFALSIASAAEPAAVPPKPLEANVAGPATGTGTPEAAAKVSPEKATAPAASAPGAQPAAATAGGAAPGAPTTPAAPPPAAGAPAAGPAAGPAAAPAAAAPPGAPPGSPTKPPSLDDEVQLSFSGANVDVVVKWLAEMTGKSVVKHKGVSCQLTIVNPKKVPLREALALVYRALAMEGFSAIENDRSIVILPEASELKAGTELIEGDREGPQGKQIVVRPFTLQYAQAANLKDKIKVVLSEKAKVEIDERANKIIVNDTADNVRIVAELIRQLDIQAVSDAAVEIIPLKHAEAEGLALILNAIFGEGLPARGQQQGQPQQGQPPQPGKQPQAPSGDAVKILADKGSNRLVVMAPKKKIEEIRSLAESLDTEKPADVTVRVINLRHVSGRDLVQELGPLYQKIRGASSKDIIEIAANSRSNSIIVLSSEANFQALEKVVTSLDTESAEENTIRSFSLKNADAQDVADQLEELYKKGGSGGDDDWYPYYYRRSRDREAGTRFVADRRRNVVIAIGPLAPMESIKKTIETLDEPIEGEDLTPRIFPLKFVNALDVEQVLNELFLKKREQRRYWDDYYGSSSQTQERDIGRLYGKVRIASETYTNSIIVTTNSAENFEAIKTILEKLDVPSEASATTMNYPLKFAKAVTLSNNLNILFAQSGSPQRRQGPQEGQPRQQQQNRPQGDDTTTTTSFALEDEVVEETFFPWLGGPQENRTVEGRTTRPVSDLVGKVRVVPDIRTNSLLITTNPHYFMEVLKVVKDLDIPTPQVLIEAKIVEVKADFRRRLGVRWSPDGSTAFDSDDLDNSFQPGVDASYRDVFAGSTLADSMRTGILDAKVSLDFLIQFLAKKTDSRVRAEPRINVANNERGKLFVGSRVPFISGSLNTTEGGRSDTFKYLDVGIILEVTPHINKEDQIALRIRVEASQIRPGETLFGGAIVDTRNYRTDLVVKSGETLVLGGIIQNEESEVVRKVPLLGDIPILGWLFKKKDTINRDMELMVFLRPVVTQTPEDVKRLMEEERARTPEIQRWDRKIEEERRAAEDAIKKEEARQMTKEMQEEAAAKTRGEKRREAPPGTIPAPEAQEPAVLK